MHWANSSEDVQPVRFIGIHEVHEVQKLLNSGTCFWYRIWQVWHKKVQYWIQLEKLIRHTPNILLQRPITNELCKPNCDTLVVTLSAIQ